MKNPRFTVLLPTHNRQDVLKFSIASVLFQTEGDFELLIVADGCTDATIHVIETFADPRIRLYNLPKAKYFGYANRNIALRESKGRLIALAAHDDIFLPDHLKLMGDLLDNHLVSWGYSRPLCVSTDGIMAPLCTNLNLPDEYKYFLEQGNTIPSTCVVHTKKALEQAGFWPENVPAAADFVLWKQMIKNNNGHLAFLRQPTTLHFSANWKHCRYAKLNEMRTLLSLADQSIWWPEILKGWKKNETMTEQEAIWNAIQVGKEPWVHALRDACDTVIDKIAWQAIREFIPNYEAISKSRSWKLTKPLRKLSKWF